MDADTLSRIEEFLREHYGIELAEGLRDSEVAEVEQKYNFRFPPDLKALLQHVLPVSDGFPDWRNGDEEELRLWLDDPAEGILLDIEQSGFWLEAWGPRPDSLLEAFEVARRELEQAPRLIPLYIHRFLPSEPLLPGNSIFSVYGSDTIYYGGNLLDYFQREFGWSSEYRQETYREIRLWSYFPYMTGVKHGIFYGER